jgi:hypothetical protein
VETPRSIYLVHRSMEVGAEASGAMGVETSSSEGETTTSNEMMELEMNYGRGTRSTVLAEREC